MPAPPCTIVNRLKNNLAFVNIGQMVTRFAQLPFTPTLAHYHYCYHHQGYPDCGHDLLLLFCIWCDQHRLYAFGF